MPAYRIHNRYTYTTNAVTAFLKILDSFEKFRNLSEGVAGKFGAAAAAEEICIYICDVGNKLALNLIEITAPTS